LPDILVDDRAHRVEAAIDDQLLPYFQFDIGFERGIDAAFGEHPAEPFDWLAGSVAARPQVAQGRGIARPVVARGDLVEERPRLRMAGQDVMGRDEVVVLLVREGADVFSTELVATSWYCYRSPEAARSGFWTLYAVALNRTDMD